IPAYLVGVGGVAKATEGLTTQIMQRVESGLAKIAKKQIPTKVERAAMQSFRTAATGQEVSEEALLREAYGLVRASITQQMPQRVAQFGGEISKRALIKHLPNIVQKELGQLGYTIDDMAKMSLKDARQLATSKQTKTGVQIENVVMKPIKLPPGQQKKVAAVEKIAEEATLAERQLTKEQQKFLVRFEKLARETGGAEKAQGIRMSPEAVSLWKKDWKAYSRARGYTEKEIAQYQKYMRATEEGQKLGFSLDDLASYDLKKVAEQAKLTSKPFIYNIESKKPVIGESSPFKGQTITHKTYDVTTPSGQEALFATIRESEKVVEISAIKSSNPRATIEFLQEIQKVLAGRDLYITGLSDDSMRLLRGLENRGFIQVPQNLNRYAHNKIKIIAKEIVKPFGEPFSVPLEEQPAIRKLVDFTYSLKRARLETERLYTEARKAQAAQLRAIAKAKAGGEAYVPSLKALSGKLPKGEAELPTPFTAKELKQFKDVIYTTRQLPPMEQDAFIRTHLSHTLMEMIEKRTIPGAKDIEYLELVFGKGLGKAFRDLRSVPLKIYDAFLEVMNIPRAIKASWDLSSLYRQGALVLTDRPQQIPAAFKAQVKAVFSDKWAKQVHDATHMTDWEGVMQRSKLFRPDFWGEATRLSTREEAFISRFLRASIPTGIKGVRIPIAPGVKRSERAYIVGLNKVRTDYFIYMCEQAQKMGVKLTDAEYNRIAGAVNIMTGRGEAAALNETLTALSGIFFSPRFQLSRIMTPTLLWSRSPVVRKMAARSLMKFFGFWTAVFGGIKLMDDPNVTADWWDYRSTDTGKIRIGNTRIAPLAGYDSWMRFASRLITGKIKTQTGRVQDIDLGRLIWNYARSKFAPG
ncbi:MAG: hypothetical protein KKD18_04225, partial [Nanoarchaeota archaeon]|nr:hypothetical protein [Nanoarchaeota archaeon]